MLRTERKTISVYSYKYIISINDEVFEIASNLSECDFLDLLLNLSSDYPVLKDFKYLDCLEFTYTNENSIVTVETLLKLL